MLARQRRRVLVPRCAPVASTLELLEWEKLSAQVAGFAGTGHGRELLRGHGLPLPEAREESEQLLAETREAWTIEQRLAKPLDLRGFHELSQPVSLAEKGGVLDGEQLVAVVGDSATRHVTARGVRSQSSTPSISVQQTTRARIPGTLGSRIVGALRATMPWAQSALVAMSFTASGIAHATASGTTEAESTKSVLWAAVGGGGAGSSFAARGGDGGWYGW